MKKPGPSMDDFRDELEIMIEEAGASAKGPVVISALELHKRVKRRLGLAALQAVPMACNALSQRYGGRRLPGGPPSGYGTRVKFSFQTGGGGDRKLRERRADYRDVITLDPGKRGGKPCIRGLCITVYDILDYLAAGMSDKEILSDFPDLRREDIQASLAFAADRERRLMSLSGR